MRGGGELFDAAVIGGGPAGGLAALLLSRLRWRVILLEARPRQRLKACGDCLSHRGVTVLRRCGALESLRSAVVGWTHQVRVHVPGTASPPCTFPIGTGSAESGRVIRRDRFDQALVDLAAAAGAVVVQPAAARVLTIDDRGGIVRVVGAQNNAFDIRCGLVVGADGLNSAAARGARLHTRSAGRQYGFSLEMTGAASLEPGTIEMFVTTGGYLGVVQHGHSLHAAALVRGGRTAARNPRGFLAWMCEQFPALHRIRLENDLENGSSGVLAAGPIPWRPRGVAAGPVALVGDAAGFIEPFTGEGMAWALESAELLARIAATTTPGRWNSHQATLYSNLWRRSIGRRHRACAMVASTVRRPRLLGLTSWWLSAHPGAAERLAAWAT
jgi:flavin-dependent dehydrogenase